MSTRRRQPLLSAVLLLLFLSLPPSFSANQESDPISRFRDYLRINTAHPKPNYDAAVEYLTAFAATITRIFYLTIPDKPLLLITGPGSDASLPSVLLNPHLDSIPAEPSKWLHPPLRRPPHHRRPHLRPRLPGRQVHRYAVSRSNQRAKKSNLTYTPLRTVHISYVPEEELDGFDGMMKFVESKEFQELNIGFMLDEGQTSVNDEFRVFYAERSPWHVVIKARGPPGHGSRMYDNDAMENLMKSVEMMMKFRVSGFHLVKAGLAANSE